jgi:palmitoyl-protein thioesterase
MSDHKVKRYYTSTTGLQDGQFIGPDKVKTSIANNCKGHRS